MILLQRRTSDFFGGLFGLSSKQKSSCTNSIGARKQGWLKILMGSLYLDSNASCNGCDDQCVSGCMHVNAAAHFIFYPQHRKCMAAPSIPPILLKGGLSPEIEGQSLKYPFIKSFPVNCLFVSLTPHFPTFLIYFSQCLLCYPPPPRIIQLHCSFFLNPFFV